MRVVFVIPYFYGAWAYGGQPRSAFELARGLVNLGHSVKVLTTDSAGLHRMESGSRKTLVRNIDGIQVIYYPNVSNRLAFHHRLFWPTAFFGDLENQIAGSDIIHIHELRSFLTVKAALSASRMSLPFVLSPHGGLPYLGKRSAKVVFDSLWGNRILRSAAAVVAVSPLEEADARKKKIDMQRVCQIPNPFASAEFDRLPQQGLFRNKRQIPDGKMVLFLGRLHPVKGADLLIESFLLLADEWSSNNLRLVIAGPDDGQLETLRRMVRRSRIADRIIFTGYLNQQEKLEALVDCDLVVVPSRSEVFAITAVESLLCSRPVLLSSACGLLTTITRAHGALLFQNGDVHDLEAKIREALNDKDLPASAANGRTFVKKEFDVERIAKRIEALYSCVTTQPQTRTDQHLVEVRERR